METSSLELELRKLDLKEKEAKVYLAGLELGPSPVKLLAEKTKMTRPTVYEIIKQLEEKGLFNEAKEGKKRLFSAKSPESILGILRVKKREVEEKEREFIRIIAALEDKYSKGWAGFKTFKGKGGLRALAEIISFTASPQIFIFNEEQCPIDWAAREKIFEAIKKRLGKIEIKKIKTSLEGSLMISGKAVFFPAGRQEGYLFP